MKIVEQSARIMNISHENPLIAIEESARNCYQSTSNGDTKKFVANLIQRGHLSCLEMVDIQVEIICSRGIMAELTRHRLCSFNIESSRFVNYKDGVEFILPQAFKDRTGEGFAEWNWSMRNAEASYIRLIEQDYKAEVAREVLPNSTKTTIIIKSNLRNWIEIFRLRTHVSSHPDMVALMTPLKHEMMKAVRLED